MAIQKASQITGLAQEAPPDTITSELYFTENVGGKEIGVGPISTVFVDPKKALLGGGVFGTADIKTSTNANDVVSPP